MKTRTLDWQWLYTCDGTRNSNPCPSTLQIGCHDANRADMAMLDSQWISGVDGTHTCWVCGERKVARLVRNAKRRAQYREKKKQMPIVGTEKHERAALIHQDQ